MSFEKTYQILNWSNHPLTCSYLPLLVVEYYFTPNSDCFISTTHSYQLFHAWFKSFQTNHKPKINPKDSLTAKAFVQLHCRTTESLTCFIISDYTTSLANYNFPLLHSKQTHPSWPRCYVRCLSYISLLSFTHRLNNI